MKRQNYKRIFLLILIVGIVLNSFSGLALAAKTKKKKYLTKGDAIALISATDFVKNKIGALLSWTIGYDISKVNRAKLVPIINYIIAVPKKVPPDGRTVVELQASVDDPGGLTNIQGVRADLSGLGKLSNMILVDNGLWGDEKANDGIYTIQTNISQAVSLGEKEVAVAVANKKGWVAMGKTTLLVLTQPKIVNIRVNPDKVVADGKSVVFLEVQIENPGRVSDIKRVFANLLALGGDEVTLLRNDGKDGDRISGDSIFTAKFKVKRGISTGAKDIPVYVENLLGGTDMAKVSVTVVSR